MVEGKQVGYLQAVPSTWSSTDNWNSVVSVLCTQLNFFQGLHRKIPDGGQSGTWTKDNQISILLPLTLICK